MEKKNKGFAMLMHAKLTLSRLARVVYMCC
jgi:hypothetical protein